MKIVTTFHHPSSVLASLKCRLSARDVDHLVVAKLNRLEVYSLHSTGIKLECSLEIYGKVTAVKAIPVPKSTRSTLVVLLAHPDPELIFLSYAESEDGLAELQPTHHLSLFERSLRPAEFFNDVLIHPSGKLAAVSCYVGKLKIIQLKAGRYEEDFDVMIPEFNLFSLAFLPLPEQEYALAIVHMDHQQRIQLLARDIDVDEGQLSTFPSTHLHTTVISAKSFPFPADHPPRLATVHPPDASKVGDDEDDQIAALANSFLGGVLVVGGKNIVLFELVDREGQEKQKGKRKRLEDKKKSKNPLEKEKAREKEAQRESRRRTPRASVAWPWSDVVAWCSIGDTFSRFVLGDAYGKLAVLSLDHLQDLGLVLIPLGEVSPPTSLTYLTNQILYVGSHMGDSQLVQITTTPNADVDRPTLPIPPEIHCVTLNSFDASTSRKGKGRAMSPTFDMDVDDDEASDSQGPGSIIATKGSHVNVLERFKNIAPIVDASLIDIDGGQRQLITCSGGKNTGSLNIVRNGADFQEIMNIPAVPNVTRVWSLRSRLEDVTDSFLLLSSHDSSRLIRIDDNGGSVGFTPIDNRTMDGLRAHEPTIACSNVAQRVVGQGGKARYVNSSLIVQVTSSGAFLLELDETLQMHALLNSWEVKANSLADHTSQIVAASINSSQVAIAMSEGRITLLSVTEEKKLRKVVSTPELSRLPDVSAISCTPLNPTQAFSKRIVVSYWLSNIIEVLAPSETGLKSIYKTTPLPSSIVSLLFYNFGKDQSSRDADYHPYLLAGLSDGSVATFSWQDQELKDRKIITLGHAPVSLIVCSVDLGLDKSGGGNEEREGTRSRSVRTVLAAGSRAVVFAHERNRLGHSPVLLKNIHAAASVNTVSLSSSLIFASEEGLHIGRIKDLNKLHIRSIPFGLDNPRRIAYQPILKAFGVAFTRTEPARVGLVESTSSSFKLIDDSSFEELAGFSVKTNEEITSVLPIAVNVDNELKPFFIVGTFIYEPEETEPEIGRVLLVSVSIAAPSRTSRTAYQLSVIAESEVKGCVYALTSTNSSSKGHPRFAAAVNSSIMLFQLTIDGNVFPATLELKKVTEWNHNYLVTSLGSVGEHVFAGDQISSVSLLKTGEERFQTVARDYGPQWPICVEAIDEKNVIGANDALNLFTFTLSKNLNRNVLECTGGYHIADLVTKIIRGSLSVTDQSEEPVLQPEELFFTSSGRIGVIVDVKKGNHSLHLTELQRNMAAVIPSVGGISHTRFRAPKSARGRSDADQASFGFLDGDFMEQLLTLRESPDTLERISNGQSEPEKLSVSLDDMRRQLEVLQSYH